DLAQRQSEIEHRVAKRVAFRPGAGRCGPGVENVGSDDVGHKCCALLRCDGNRLPTRRGCALRFGLRVGFGDGPGRRDAQSSAYGDGAGEAVFMKSITPMCATKPRVTHALDGGKSCLSRYGLRVEHRMFEYVFVEHEVGSDLAHRI